MDNVSDAYFLVKVLLSISVFGCTIVPLFADFNKTHATNPKWTGHARFHVVWQCLSYGAIGILSYYLLWFYQSNEVTHLYLVALLNAFIYAGFFCAYFSMRIYGGKAFDDNGYLPIQTKIINIDLNVATFSIFSLILLCAFLQLHLGIFN